MVKFEYFDSKKFNNKKNNLNFISLLQSLSDHSQVIMAAAANSVNPAAAANSVGPAAAANSVGPVYLIAEAEQVLAVAERDATAAKLTANANTASREKKLAAAQEIASMAAVIYRNKGMDPDTTDVVLRIQKLEQKVVKTREAGYAAIEAADEKVRAARKALKLLLMMKNYYDEIEAAADRAALQARITSLE